MRRKIITPNARADLHDISDFIRSDHQEAADRYYRSAISSFEDLPDILKPERASPLLPETVRKIPVKGFAGYTLHIAILDDATYLIAAFRPGLSDARKLAQSGASLKTL